MGSRVPPILYPHLEDEDSYRLKPKGADSRGYGAAEDEEQQRHHQMPPSPVTRSALPTTLTFGTPNPTTSPLLLFVAGLVMFFGGFFLIALGIYLGHMLGGLYVAFMALYIFGVVGIVWGAIVAVPLFLVSSRSGQITVQPSGSVVIVTQNDMAIPCIQRSAHVRSRSLSDVLSADIRSSAVS